MFIIFHFDDFVLLSINFFPLISGNNPVLVKVVLVAVYGKTVFQLSVKKDLCRTEVDVGKRCVAILEQRFENFVIV